MSRLPSYRFGPTTVVIPCYNEGNRLPPFLESLCDLFAPYPELSIVVVDDGSKAEHVAKVEASVTALRPKMKGRLELIKAAHGGKGSALLHGFLHAKTPVVGFIDADGATNGNETLRVLNELWEGETTISVATPSATIASRVPMLGRSIVKLKSRRLLGRVFAFLLSWIFQMDSYDTQCGCKFFVRERALPFLSKIQSRTWLWDTQLVIFLHYFNHEIREVPISWVEVAGSKVSLIRDPLRMFRELLKFKRHLALVKNFPAYRDEKKDVAYNPPKKISK